MKEDGDHADPEDLTDKQMVDIARVGAGGSFGALSLIDGKPRMATIKCLIRTHLLVLSKSDWKKCEHDIRKRKT